MTVSATITPVSSTPVSSAPISRGTGSRRDRLWNACVDKTCCRTTRVHVTGADLGRLVEALELPAVSLITAVPLRPPEDRNGFRLWRDGPAFELVLRKNGPIGAAGAPCLFLVETNDGHALCGAGEVRPTSCRAFPAVADGDDVRALSGLCPCRAWTDADLGDAERDAARTAAAEESADGATIARWNDLVQAGARRRSLDEFCTHLLSDTHLLTGRDAS